MIALVYVREEEWMAAQDEVRNLRAERHALCDLIEKLRTDSDSKTDALLLAGKQIMKLLRQRDEALASLAFHKEQLAALVLATEITAPIDVAPAGEQP